MERIFSIRNLLDETQELVKTQAPKIYSKDLVELLFTQPYCKIQFLVEAGIAKRQTASVYLQTLERLGLLTSQKAGRDVYYINHHLMEKLRL